MRHLPLLTALVLTGCNPIVIDGSLAGDADNPDVAMDSAPDTEADVAPDRSIDVLRDTPPDPPPDVPADLLDAAPDRADAAPDRSDAALDLADATPDRADVAPDRSDAVPDLADATLDLLDAAFDRADAAPDRADAAPDRADATLDLLDATPDRPDAAPDVVDAAPDRSDAPDATPDGPADPTLGLPVTMAPTWPETRVGGPTSWVIRLPSATWSLASHPPDGPYLAGVLAGSAVTAAFDPGGRSRWRAAFAEGTGGSLSLDASAAGALVASQPRSADTWMLRVVRYTPTGAVAAHRLPNTLSCNEHLVQVDASGAAEVLCTNYRNVPVDGFPLSPGHPTDPHSNGYLALLTLSADLRVTGATSWPWVVDRPDFAAFPNVFAPETLLGGFDRAGTESVFDVTRLTTPTDDWATSAYERSVRMGRPLEATRWQSTETWPQPSRVSPTRFVTHRAVWRVAVTPSGVGYAAIATRHPAAAQSPVTDPGTRDIVLAAYNRSGAIVWSRRYGSSGDDTLGGIAVTADGEIALTGSFATPFSTGAGTLISAGGRDGFLLIVGPDGATRAAERFGGAGDDAGTAVAAAGGSDVYFAGTFTGAATFPNGSLTAAPGEGSFLARYGASCPSPRVACGGRCVDTATDVAHCGACAAPCDFANATPICAAGRCALGACDAGFVDCDRRADNGCEVHTGSDPAHCGACGRTCAAGESCRAGRCCAGAACPPDPFPSNGSEGAFAPTRDVTLAAGVHHFTWVRIPAGVTVRSEGSAVLELRARGPVDIAGAIDVSGLPGGTPRSTPESASGGAGGVWGGGRGGSYHDIFGVSPGQAGQGPGGGAGGTLTTAAGGGTIGAAALADLPVRSTFSRGSGGGGAVLGGYGGGGGAGGALRVSSPERIVLAATTRLRANGGAPGPGGGGGSGGVVYLAAPTLRVPVGAEVSAAGGSGAGGVGRVRVSTTRATCTLDGSLTPPATPSCASSPAAGTPGFAYVGAWPD
jgi:hypothetical protein